MTNAEIIKTLPKLKHIKERLRQNQQRVKKLEEIVDVDINIVDILSRVKEVYEGIALNVFKRSNDNFAYHSIGYGIRRAANVYQSAVDSKSWGLNLWGFDWNTDRNFGCGWKKKDAIIAAKRFVALGEIPVRRD